MNFNSFLNEVIGIIKWRSRNIFIDPFYIIYWDIIPKLKCKRHYQNTFLKDKETKIPVTILTYKRPWYFKKTLKSFLRMNESILDRLLVIVLVQGERDEETEKIINKYSKQFYKIIHSDVNLGIAGGWSFLMKEALKLNLPYIIHLEDDFLSNESLSLYIPELLEIFVIEHNIGCVRLRSIKDEVSGYNMISRRKIKYKNLTENVAIGNAHFTLNPTIARSSVIKKIFPVHSEKEAMKKYQKLGLRAGQLLAECFSHLGDERVKDWID